MSGRFLVSIILIAILITLIVVSVAALANPAFASTLKQPFIKSQTLHGYIVPLGKTSSTHALKTDVKTYKLEAKSSSVTQNKILSNENKPVIVTGKKLTPSKTSVDTVIATDIELDTKVTPTPTPVTPEVTPELPTAPMPSTKATLTGTITISVGVCTINVPCGLYKNGTLLVYQSDGVTLADQIKTDNSGKYSLALSAGDYIVYTQNGIYTYNKKKNSVHLNAGETKTMDFYIDTGVR